MSLAASSLTFDFIKRREVSLPETLEFGKDWRRGAHHKRDGRTIQGAGCCRESEEDIFGNRRRT